MITAAHHSERLAGERKCFLKDEKARDERQNEGETEAGDGPRLGKFRIYGKEIIMETFFSSISYLLR